MNKFRVNTNKAVLQYNLSSVKPGTSKEDWTTRSISLTDETNAKLETLRAKYKVSRSAIVRILLDSVE